jgi:hypothetical protein
MSIRSIRIAEQSGKVGYVHNTSKGHYTMAELVERAAGRAIAKGKKWLDFRGDIYDLRSGKPVAWYNVPVATVAAGKDASEK